MVKICATLCSIEYSATILLENRLVSFNRHRYWCLRDCHLHFVHITRLHLCVRNISHLCRFGFVKLAGLVLSLVGIDTLEFGVEVSVVVKGTVLSSAIAAVRLLVAVNQLLL